MTEPKQDPLVSALIGADIDFDHRQHSLLAERIREKLNRLGVTTYNSGGGSLNLYGRILAWLDTP